MASAAEPTGIIVPLYTYPDSTWDSVVQQKNAHPTVPIIAIINPDNGPGASQDPSYITGIQKLRSSGVTVLGYVYTLYGSRSASIVTADIDQYKSWYNVNGIFFDEMSNISGHEAYYKKLSDYAKSNGLAFTVGNPGLDTLSSYVGTVDNLIIYENAGLPSTTSISGWHTDYDKKSFSLLSYAVSALDRSFFSSVSNHVGYMYITNDNLPNPWDALPSYFADLVASLDIVPPTQGSQTISPVSTQGSLTIQSVSLSGSSISGLWTEISSNGNIVKKGYTPLSYTASYGTQYTVCVSNYKNYLFDHWDNGSTNSCTTVTPIQKTVLTADYKVKVSLKVRSVSLSGSSISGLWTEISSNGNIVKKGYTPLSYTASYGTQYTVCVSNYKNYLFDHWDNGSTNSCTTVTPIQKTVLTADYIR